MTSREELENTMAALYAAASAVFTEFLDVDTTTIRVTYSDGTAEVLPLAEILRRAGAALGVDLEQDKTP